ncbi:MAG TPA: hypothetical protein VK633_11945 [Verrucomicrobiae bacterium]|nr:hypothetical protein [Verrucomicrobiae bacterium]
MTPHLSTLLGGKTARSGSVQPSAGASPKERAPLAEGLPLFLCFRAVWLSVGALGITRKQDQHAKQKSIEEETH